jgi:MFS family permease
MSLRPERPAETGVPPVEPAPIPARGLRHAVRAFRHRDFALFWVGAFISSVGTWMQAVTVPFILHEATGSAAWVGYGAAAQFLPAMVVGPAGGAAADRYSRRRILLLSQSAAGVFALALWASVRTGRIHPLVIIGLVVGSGFASGYGIPAWQAFVPELVPREALLNAVALNSAQFNASRAVGFMIGGLTLSRFGPGAAFLANGLSYLAVIAAVVAVRAGRPGHPAGARPAGSFREGLAYVWARPGLRLVIVTVIVVAFLGNPVIQLAPVFARDVYHVGEGAYGLLASALGIGATLGSVILGAYGDQIRRSRLVVVATAAYGGAVIGLGLSPSYAGGVVAMFAVGMGFLVIVSALNTTLQLSVDDRFRGRALALYIMAFTGSYPIGSLLQGALADAVGVRPVVAGAGFAIVAYAAVLAVRPVLTRPLDGQPPETRR